MNTLSTLAMRLNSRSKQWAATSLSSKSKPSGLVAQIKEAVTDELGTSRQPAGYRMGEAVFHGRFGIGKVMAQYPDGRLQIRFDDYAKSQLIYPSLLNRVPSQAS